MRYTSSELMSFGVPPALARILATKFVVPLYTSAGWTQSVSGTATASIDAVNKKSVLTVETTGIGDGANRYMINQIDSSLDTSSIEFTARLKITNGDVNSRASLVLASSTSFDLFVVSVWGDGTIERGALISNSWFSAGYSTPSTFNTSGIGWIRMRVDGTQLQESFGVGSEISEPTRWNIINNSNFSFPSIGVTQFDRLELGGGQYVTPSAAQLRVEFSDVYAKKF